jgi:hypothetical protein
MSFDELMLANPCLSHAPKHGGRVLPAVLAKANGDSVHTPGLRFHQNVDRRIKAVELCCREPVYPYSAVLLVSRTLAVRWILLSLFFRVPDAVAVRLSQPLISKSGTSLHVKPLTEAYRCACLSPNKCVTGTLPWTLCARHADAISGLLPKVTYHVGRLPEGLHRIRTEAVGDNGARHVCCRDGRSS